MKTIIMFILLIPACIILSQTREPEPIQFHWNTSTGTTTAFASTTDGTNNNNYFKQNNFMLGYMWGGERKISESLRMTQADPSTAYGVWNGTETRTD
jgi:hypothetical protein